MVKRALHCLNCRFSEIGIIVKMQFNIARRKDPMELYYNFINLFLYNEIKVGSLVGKTVSY